MPHEVPQGRLLAEAEAWPLVSECAYDLRLTRLARESLSQLEQGTASLADALDEHQRVRAGGMSLANLSVLRDRAWFSLGREDPPSRLEVPLVEHLIHLSTEYLAHAGIQTILRSDSPQPGWDAAERAIHWRWLSLRLPADLLVSALYARDGGIPPVDHVSLASTHLARILKDYPVAETHLHASAALGFPMLWTAWMSHLAVESPGFSGDAASLPFGTVLACQSRLIAAALGRFLLGHFLAVRQREILPGGFLQFIQLRLPRLSEEVRWLAPPEEITQQCHLSLAELYGTLSQSLPNADFVRSIYAALIGHAGQARPGTYDDLVRADPLWRMQVPPLGGACAETVFSARALGYLNGPGRGDTSFAELFWQYQRVRCRIHAYLVQEPGTSGLDWFRKHFGRLSAFSGPLSRRGRFEAAVRHQSNGLRLSALELRVSPGKRWESLRDQAMALAELGRALHPDAPSRGLGEDMRSRPTSSGRGIELGLIVHFLKAREGGRPLRIHADPGQNGTEFRFGSWYRERELEARALVTALSATRHPELLLLIRGLDVASSERAVPTWATAPLLHQVRDESVAASTRLRTSKLGWSIPPLQLTYHAGEEFSRLVEGLRRVQELRAAGLLQSGDRIGHGVSLGLSPRRWAASARQVLQPLEDRLDDLLWEMERYGRGEVTASMGRLERVRSAVMLLSAQMYLEPRPNLDELLALRGLLHQRGELARRQYPHAAPATAAPGDLLMRYLTDVNVFRRGQRPIEVPVDEAEVGFLEEAQRWLCADLSRMEITIEVNPSSNLLIADLFGMEDHPVFQLSEEWLVPPEPEGLGHSHGARRANRERSELLVSLSSDDPITFATRLADEYAYLYFALLRRRVPSARALDWIHQLRERGMRSRFTVEESSKLENLDAFIESLRPLRESRFCGHPQ